MYFDAIVVGAGPAGSAAAYTLAKSGVKTALLERGPFPGSKNMFGGSIYRIPTEEVFPAFWKEAPVERPVVTEKVFFTDTDSAVEVGFTGQRFAQPPYNSFTADRARFDPYLAAKAVQAGARLFTEATVRELIYRRIGLTEKTATGVILDDGSRLYGDVVIIAEGVGAFLTRKAGLRSDFPPSTVTLYLRELLALPGEKIEERFQLEKGHGAAYGFLGHVTGGAIGKAGIWTMKEGLSIIIGGYLDQLLKKRLNLFDLLVTFKKHPVVKPLLAGAKPVSYQAHLIPKGGFRYLPQLYANGILVAGDAALMVSGRRGTDLAMLSGKYAADTVVLAKARQDFSARILAAYQNRLNRSFFMYDIKKDRNTLNYFHQNPDADLIISKTFNEAAYQVFTQDMRTEEEKTRDIITELLARQLPLKTLRDAYSALRYWGVF